MDMKDFGDVDYLKVETPPGYKCSKCGATGCKLWCYYQAFLEHQDLVCAKCAAEEEEEDIRLIDKHGMHEGICGPTDQIGNRIPAVPTEGGDTFWGYTSIPEPGCIWWRSLPTLPA